MKKSTVLMSIFVSACALAADVTEVKVRAMDGFGGDTSSVASLCQTRPGQAYDPVIVTRDVNSLKKSGEFEDITVDAQRVSDGVEVTFFVKRKMRYAGPLAVKGNEEFSESKVSSEAELKDGYLYGESDLAAAAARVRLAYQKKHYPDAKVAYQTKLIGGNDVSVTFVIDEGQRQKVAEYVFSGAEHAFDVPLWRTLRPGWAPSEDKVPTSELREAISDFPWWNPVGWFADTPVTKDQLAQCCDKLAEVYRNHGYLDVKVSGPERVPAGDGKCNLVYKFEEGPQYHIGSMSITGLTRYPEDAVKERSQLPRAGAVAGEKVLQDAAHRIEVAVGSGDLGLADTHVDVRCIPTTDGGTVNIVFKVTEGVPVVINEVKIRGNDYTMDKVIRREIALGPGDRMLADRAESSQKRLENLDYFQRVRYYLEATERGKDQNGAEWRDLVYEVEEKNTGSFMVGVGASTVDSVYISAEVNQNNFDIFAPSKLFRGAGQKGRVYVAWGPRYQSAEVGFVEPHLFGRYLELSIDLYRRLRWYDQYDLIRSGAMASLSYPVKFWPTWEPFGRLGFGLSGEYIEFDDVDWGNYTYAGRTGPLFYMEEREHGDAFEPVLHFFWKKDSRDNFRIPTRGHVTRIFLDVAPAGDNEYWRVGFNHRSYFNVWRQLFGADIDHVLMAALRAETIDAISDELPIYDRMFLGGPRSIRGIKYRHVSPMARRTWGGIGPWGGGWWAPYGGWYGYVPYGDYAPWGGQTLVCANFEYTIPIVKMLRFAIFSDLGSVAEDTWDVDLSSTFAWTVGAGLRLDIPMFPIRLDVATPIKEPDEADKEVFSFTGGYDF